MRKLLFVFVFGAAAMAAHAQTTPLKIAFADPDYIYSQLPDAKKIDSELQTLQTQLKANIDTKIQDFQKKLAEYQQYGATVPDAVRQNTERELQQMQQNIQKLQEDAQNNLQQKQNTLMQPVLTNIGKAIEDVAKENGYSFVFTSQVGGLDVLLYADEKFDVSDLVLKKLGVTPAPAPQN